MKFSTTTIAGDVEILAEKDHSSFPIAVAKPDSGTVVKAGSPLTSAGVVTTGTGAIGVLLYDVDTAVDPNGAVVIRGTIDVEKCKAHSGVDISSSDLKSAVPTLILRDNIKALSGDAHLSALSIGALTLVPTFDAGVYNYETSTSNSSDTITVTAASGATAVIKNGSTTVTSGSAATWVASTTNTVTVTVTAADGATERVYTVAVDA